MIFCIPKHLVDLFLEKLKTGEISPEKLVEMTSEERNAYFSSFLGENNAKKVNSLFESKLLLKNQKKGLVNWAKQVGGIKPQLRRTLLRKVENMTEILQPKEMDKFLSDLAAQRLGFGVTVEEAGKIADLAKNVSEKKALITENMPIGSKERIEYGTALSVFKDYTSALKVESKKLSWKELLSNPGEIIQTAGGVTKSIAASLDNSFFGRQGLVTLINEPDIWMKNFSKSWGDIGKELKGVDALTPIKADVFSRPNALNGNYSAMKLDIGIDSEEAYPSALPEKIPFFGKLFKASEVAYNGAALRFRADLADRLIEKMESFGVDVKDKDTGLGILINSMTGRGKVNLTQKQAKGVNAVFFSVKFLKSQFDVLTAHHFDSKVNSKVKEQARKNILKVLATMSAILATAKMLDPESVELDPRSYDFGKIKVGKKHDIKINVSGGLGGLITLAARLIPTSHKGEIGQWYKTSKGRFIKLNDSKAFFSSGDVVSSFITGKVSPLFRAMLTFYEGKTFSGDKPTIEGEIIKLITPIPVSNLFELAKSSAGADALLYGLLVGFDFLGVNTSVKAKRKRN